LAAKIEYVSLHTLRHTFASVAADLGYSELTIAGLLGHRGSSVTARYAHVPDQALISAANHVSGEIERALKGEKTVVPLKIASA
jgi:integrase